MTRPLHLVTALAGFVVLSILSAHPALAQTGFNQAFGGMPALTVSDNNNGTATYSLSLQILMLMTALTVLPSLVLGKRWVEIEACLTVLERRQVAQQPVADFWW